MEVLTILCRCENVETSEGVPLYVTGVAQVIILQLPNTLSNSLFSFEQQQQQQDNIKTDGFLMGQLKSPYSPLLALLQHLLCGTPQFIGNADRYIPGKFQIQHCCT